MLIWLYERGMFEITMYGQSDLNNLYLGLICSRILCISLLHRFNPNCEFGLALSVRAALDGVARLEAVWNFLRSRVGARIIAANRDSTRRLHNKNCAPSQKNSPASRVHKKIGINEKGNNTFSWRAGRARGAPTPKNAMIDEARAFY